GRQGIFAGLPCPAGGDAARRLLQKGAIRSGVSFCRGMRAKDGQITGPIWSAATCRRFRYDAGAIAADKSPHSKRCLDRAELRLPLLIAPKSSSSLVSGTLG